MSAASSPNPSNLLLLAVLGIGAYWMLSRRAVAQPVYGAQRPGNGSANAQLLNTGLNALGRLFSGSGGGGSASAGTYDGRARTPWDVTPDGDTGQRANNPSAYVAPSASNDGVVVNSPFVPAYEWAPGEDYWM